MSDNGWRMIDPQFVEIPIVVPDGWCSMVSDNSWRHAEMYSGIQVDTLDCREETYLVEHGDSSPL